MLCRPGTEGDHVHLQGDFPPGWIPGDKRHEAVDDNGTNPMSQAFACLTKPLSFNVFLETLHAAAREGKVCATNGASHE